MTAYRAVDLFSRSQLARGVLLALLAVTAIYWPDATLPWAMSAGGTALMLSGGFDAILAAATHRVMRGWGILALHGVASLAFGLLTLRLPRLEQRTALQLVAGWMVLYGLLMTALAFALWPMRRTRWALIGVSVLVATLAIIAPLMSGLPSFVPLYLGAYFAMLFGVAHIVAGLWLRQVAMPEFAPTVQSTWAPPAARRRSDSGSQR